MICSPNNLQKDAREIRATIPIAKQATTAKEVHVGKLHPAKGEESEPGSNNLQQHYPTDIIVLNKCPN